MQPETAALKWHGFPNQQGYMWRKKVPQSINLPAALKMVSACEIPISGKRKWDRNFTRQVPLVISDLLKLWIDVLKLCVTCHLRPHISDL